jgi:SAM-dependent methyltransferase
MARSVDDVRKHYDGLSFGQFSYGDRRAGFYPLIDEFLSHASPASTVIDVGCGAGFWLDEFTRRGVPPAQLLGVDLAPDNVRRTRERGHRAEVGNVLELAQPDGAFDLTFCAGVIHHTPDPARALHELARITKPGGHIYLAVYNRWHPYFWVVHKATAPLRWLHWHGWQRASRAAYRIWKIGVQPAGWVAFGRSLDEQTCYALWMDQVLTPYAHLYTGSGLRRLAARCGLEMEQRRYALRGLMIVALMRKPAA